MTVGTSGKGASIPDPAKNSGGLGKDDGLVSKQKQVVHM